MIQKLAQFEKVMLAQLRSPAITTATAKRVLKRTSCQFVLDYGWFYTPSPLPKKVKPGTPNECYRNALELVLHDPSLIYVEGYASGAGGLPIRHAWVTDGHGRAIDNTCGELNFVYAGVPFVTRFVSGIPTWPTPHECLSLLPTPTITPYFQNARTVI